MSQEYQNFLEPFLERTRQITGILVFDINANLIAFKFRNGVAKRLEPIVISAGVAYLSISKLKDIFEMKNIDQLYVKTSDGYLIVLQVGENRLLLIKTTSEIKLGLILFDLRGLAAKISNIPYQMPERKVSLVKKLDEIEDEFQENYKFFFSYAKSDSTKFKVMEIADYLESHYPNVQIMYFEKSKQAGEDILDYMERGVSWCNFFIWFHSPESMKSEAVKKEYKMAVYLGKNIISITEDFNALPLSARVTWALLFNDDIEAICEKLMEDIKNYDLKVSKHEW